MPGKVKVKVLAGRNLPVMDRSSDTTDAYVEIKLGNTTYKTEVCRKSLNPVWGSEWYRYEVDDSELQDEPLQIRLMDYDTYSANDSIGKVYLDLNPLLLPMPPTLGKTTGTSDGPPNSGSASAGNVFSGWIPVFDTMHGIRGEINIIVKVELFSDFNKFRQSSCGVQFFCSPVIPSGYHVQVVHGFVEELVVNDDPEYQWIDKIRTPRASNEARQTLFFKLSGELQRKIGLKALDLGGNSVIGYNQCFDLEGESGIVVRGIGTAVTLTKIQELILPPSSHLEAAMADDRQQLQTAAGEDALGPAPAPFVQERDRDRASTSPPGAGAAAAAVATAAAAAAAAPTKVSPSPAKLCSLPAICRRSSDSDLSITPKGNSLTGSDRSSTTGLQLRAPLAPPRAALNQESLDMMEYPFLTMTKYPPGFILHIGGMVAARSVKLLERISNLEEPESRDAWWTELRMEVRSHARALACNVVLGYEEATSICDDVCVLSAAGTAAVVAPAPSPASAPAGAPPEPSAASAHGQVTPQQPQQPAPASASASATASASGAAVGARAGSPLASASGPASPSPAPSPSPAQPSPAQPPQTQTPAAAAAAAATDGDREREPSWEREKERERDRERSTPHRAPSASAFTQAFTAAAASVSTAQPLSMSSKIRVDGGATAGAAEEGGAATALHSQPQQQTQAQAQCAPCHLPYNEASVPFRVVTTRCGLCKRSKVLEFLYTTIEPPHGLCVWGRGGLLQAYVCRPKRDLGRGELNAKDISDGLPFLEYELHRALNCKLRLRGMNALFALRVQVVVGERLMVAMATGTAAFLPALPSPALPKVAAGNAYSDDASLAEAQRKIQEAVRRAREAYGLPPAPRPAAPATPASAPASTAPAAAPATAAAATSDTDDSEDDLPDLDLAAGNKDVCVFEIDDAEDMDVVTQLLEPPPPEGFAACTTELPPGVDEAQLGPGPQMFTHVWRSRLPSGQAQAARALRSVCARLLSGLFFKLRRAAPAALSRLRFRVELPDPDEIHISVLGMALGVTEVEKLPLRGRKKFLAPSCSRELISNRREEQDPWRPACVRPALLARRAAGCVAKSLRLQLETHLGLLAHLSLPPNPQPPPPPQSPPTPPPKHESELIFSLEEDQVGEAPTAPAAPPLPPPPTPAVVSAPATATPTTPAPRPFARSFQSSLRGAPALAGAPGGLGLGLGLGPGRERFGVDISPLSSAPGGRIERYLGNLNFFFIRESTSVREAGGLSGFVHSFACEVLAIVRSHVTALGGNAMVAYFMSECVLYHNPHKNQGQCLINVGGDVVFVSYDD